jgi:hypothetical protein
MALGCNRSRAHGWSRFDVHSGCGSRGDVQRAGHCSAGTSTVSWSGTLSGATYYIETVSGTDNLIVDDASFL